MTAPSLPDRLRALADELDRHNYVQDFSAKPPDIVREAASALEFVNSAYVHLADERDQLRASLEAAQDDCRMMQERLARVVEGSKALRHENARLLSEIESLRGKTCTCYTDLPEHVCVRCARAFEQAIASTEEKT